MKSVAKRSKLIGFVCISTAKQTVLCQVLMLNWITIIVWVEPWHSGGAQSSADQFHIKLFQMIMWFPSLRKMVSGKKKVGMHPGWVISPSQGTIIAHIHTLNQDEWQFRVDSQPTSILISWRKWENILLAVPLLPFSYQNLLNFHLDFFNLIHYCK